MIAADQSRTIRDFAITVGACVLVISIWFLLEMAVGRGLISANPIPQEIIFTCVGAVGPSLWAVKRRYQTSEGIFPKQK